MELNIKNANIAASILDVAMLVLFKPARIVTSELVLVTQTGATIVTLDAGGSIAQTEGVIFDLAIEGSIIAEVAKIEGFIASMAMGARIGVAGATAVGGLGVLGLTLGLSLIAGAIAVVSNSTTRDIITDPDFWKNVGDGRINEYINETYGLSLSDLLGALWEGIISGHIRESFGDVSSEVNSKYLAARGVRTGDPLVLDLDGDGIETVGVTGSNPILFDHDADGTRTGTGWIKPDDGLVVLDIDGNGTIDSGRELFGDQTMRVVPASEPNGRPFHPNGNLSIPGFPSEPDQAALAMRAQADPSTRSRAARLSQGSGAARLRLL